MILQEMKLTAHVKLVAIKDQQYKNIVFEDLSKDYDDDLRYITVVMVPNWQFSEKLEIGDRGYLQYESVYAGESQWFDKLSQKMINYKYNNLYFINFIKEQEKCNLKEFKF